MRCERLARGSAAPRGGALGGAARDQFVEGRGLRLGTQHTSQPLHVLAHRGAAAGDDGDVGVRHVHALVEHAPGDELGERAGAESLQDGAALGGRRAVGDRGQQQRAADAVHHLDVLGEDDDFSLAWRRSSSSMVRRSWRWRSSRRAAPRGARASARRASGSKPLRRISCGEHAGTAAELRRGASRDTSATRPSAPRSASPLRA